MEARIRPFLTVRILAIVWILVVAWMSVAGSDFGHRSPYSVGNTSGKHHMTATLSTQEIRHEKSQWTLYDLVIDGVPAGDRLLVFAPSSEVLASGDRVSVVCDVQPPASIDGFRYDRFLASRDIFATCFSPDIPVLIARGNHTLIDRLHTWREMIIRRIRGLYPPDAAALLSGLLIGTQTFSTEWSATFRSAGISHIVAASGSNVEMVLVVLGGALMLGGVSRRHAGLALCAGIAGYVILAGAAAPVVRAGIFAVLLIIARHLGRSSIASHLLLITAAVMLIFQPLLLLYDIGFQLSVLSTWALIVLAPRVRKALCRLPLGEMAADLFASTLAITVFTAPLILWTFGSISLVAVFANIFVLPLVPPAMLLGALSLLFSPFATVASWILATILFLARFFADLPYASLSFSYVDSFAPSAPRPFASSCLRPLV